MCLKQLVAHSGHSVLPWGPYDSLVLSYSETARVSTDICQALSERLCVLSHLIFTTTCEQYYYHPSQMEKLRHREARDWQGLTADSGEVRIGAWSSPSSCVGWEHGQGADQPHAGQGTQRGPGPPLPGPRRQVFCPDNLRLSPGLVLINCTCSLLLFKAFLEFIQGGPEHGEPPAPYDWPLVPLRTNSLSKWELTAAAFSGTASRVRGLCPEEDMGFHGRN